MTYNITGNDVEILPYQFREITGAFVPLTQRTYATSAPRAIAAAAVNPIRISAMPAPAPRPIMRAPLPQAPPTSPIRIADLPAFPAVMHTDSLNMGSFPGGGGGGAPRVATIVANFQRGAQPNIARTASQALRDYQQSISKSKGSIFGAKGSMASVIGDNTPQPQQQAAPATSADVPPSGDAFQGPGDLPPPPPAQQIGPMVDGSQQPVYGYDQPPPPNPYGYGGGWDSGYPQYQGGGGYGGGGGGGYGGNPYADQGEPPWGYPPSDPGYGYDSQPSYGFDPGYGPGYGYGPPVYDDYGYAQDAYGDYGTTDDYGADWGSDYVDDTLADAYTSSNDLAYQDLDSQYGGGLGNG